MVAVALVAGAFVVRSRRDNAKASDGPVTTLAGGTTAPTQPVGPLRVVCATELKDVCNGLGAGTRVTVEPAGTTLDRILRGGVTTVLDLWVTLDPWPAMANGTATSFETPADVVGASPLGVAFRAERQAALDTFCASTPIAQCLGDSAGKEWKALRGKETWQTLKPAFDPPTTSAVGLAAFVAAVVARPTSGSLAASDLQADDGFIAWTGRISQLARSVNPNNGLVLEQAVAQPRYDAVLTTEREFKAIAASRSFTFEAFPLVQARIVAAKASGAKVPKDVVDAVRKATGASGWDAAVTTDPLPTATEVVGLQQIWKNTA